MYQTFDGQILAPQLPVFFSIFTGVYSVYAPFSKTHEKFEHLFELDFHIA